VGDSQLAEMLQSNKQKWGNYQGVCGSGIMDMQQHYPDAYEKFLVTERQLESWLQGHNISTLPGVDQPPQPENGALPSDYDQLRQAFGDEELAEFLRRNKQKWGNYQGVCGTGIIEMQRYPDMYQQYLDTERQLEDWLQGQGTLPPLYELFRQALGDKQLAEMLQQNKHRWGNHQGVCGTAIVEMQQHYPDIYQKFLETEGQLENWMQEQGALPRAYESLRQALGDKGLADMLQGNKRNWGNYQGICGTAILELQQNYPEIYQQFLETERQLEKWLIGQSSAWVPGDHNGDGTVTLAEYTVCQVSRGSLPSYYYDGLDRIVLVVQDDDKSPIQDAIDKATKLKETLDNAETVKKVAEALEKAAEYASGENPDPIGALKLIGEAIGLMKELAPPGMSDLLDLYSSAIASIADALEKIPLTLYDRAIDKAYEETKDPQKAAELADSIIPDASAEDRERGIKRVTLRHLKSTYVPPKSFWDWEWFPWNWISTAPEQPVLPGDYNGDGIVDSADYVVWRKTDGTAQGYQTWRQNFGRMNYGVSDHSVAMTGDRRVEIIGPFPPPVTDALRIYLIVNGWKEDAIEIRDEASRQAVEIVRRERARIEQQVTDELGPLAWAVFDINQPSAGELRQRELEAESPVYILLREAVNNHADPEVRARAQGVLNTIHPTEPTLPGGVFELPADPPGPVVPGPVVPPAPVDVAGVAIQPETSNEDEQSLRYYELRIVAYDANGDEEESFADQCEFNSAVDDAARVSGSDDAIPHFDLTKLQALFGSLPADRYRIYLSEDGSERLILDFIIQGGQPVETPDGVDAVGGEQSDGAAPPAVDGAEQGVYQDAAPDSTTVTRLNDTNAATAIPIEMVQLQLTSRPPTLVQDPPTPTKLGITEEWQLVIADGKVKSITKNGKEHKDPLPANVARDIKPILTQLKAGMVGSILVRYYEVLGSDGKRLDVDGELKETITPSGGVTTGGTKVNDGVVATPDRLFHIDTDKNFKDKTLLQVIEVCDTVVAYHKITFTRIGVTVEVLTKQQYEDELKKLQQK
jgi:hypothetical protein